MTSSKVWKEWASTRAVEHRDTLVAAYQPLVRYVATRLAVSLPASVEIQDLVSYGNFGLLDAIEKYDVGRVKFETYAVQRIRGAILDELRALDWAPRSVRSKARAIEREMSRLEHELGRSPAEEELATAVGVTVNELRKSLSQSRMARQESLDRAVVVHSWASHEAMGQEATIADTIQDHTDLTLMPEVQEAARLMAEGIARLPARERTFMALYYFEGMSLAEIGRTLGVSESRVCQLHTRAAVTLQRTLAGQFAH